MRTNTVRTTQSRNAKIPVCILSRNPLANAYLVKLLLKEPRIRLLHPRALAVALLALFAAAPLAHAGRKKLLAKFDLFAGLDFWLSPENAVQASYSHSSSDFTETTRPTDPPIGGLTAVAPARLHLLSFDYIHSFPLSKRWHILLAAGLGRAWWHDPLGGSPPSSTLGNLGAGVVFNITNHWSVRAEYRDYIMSLPAKQLVGGLVHDNTPTIGIAYRF